jgi:hypothetical protein
MAKSSAVISTPAFPRQPVATIPANLAGTVTGIGSLPFTSTRQAIRMISEHCAETPFWPQLPRLSESESIIGQGVGIVADMLEPRQNGYGYQVKSGRIDAVVEALHSSSGQLTTANAVGFGVFEEAMRSQTFESASAIKGQIEGPITLATYLFYRGRAFLADASLFAAVAFHISQVVCWQIERLKVFGKQVLIFVDEPALCLDDAVSNGICQERRLNALSAIFDDVRARGAFSGLHCCAAHPFSRMCLAKPDVVSFDAHGGLERFFEDQRALDFVENGGWVAYGLIPTSRDLSAINPASIFSRWLLAASMAGDPQQLAQRAMITATCGLGLLEPSSVTKSFDLAHNVARLMRRVSGTN